MCSLPLSTSGPICRILPEALTSLPAATSINGEIYTAMSFIPGRSLKELMEERRQFSQRQLIRWAMQLCSALNYLHTQTPPIIHGDIKPANIMVTPRGDVCLIDFNVSFAVNGNTVLGYTEGYASPERSVRKKMLLM